MLAAQADRIGDEIAFSTPRGPLSYTEVTDLAARFGAGLRQLGVTSG